ncbi:MAG: glycine reductase [Chloroflexi bacterium]|nr:glycine reductase [Chloroflexota bacterium]
MFSLEIATFPVREVELGPTTRLDGDRLVLNSEELLKAVRTDPAICEARIEIVRPGESARIVHVCDAIEPRVKVRGPGTTYPGVLDSTVEVVGQGLTNRLSGLAVIESTEVPRSMASGTGANEEALIDMTGPGALSPYSKTINVVLCLQLAPGLSHQAYEHTVKQAGFRVAMGLAETTRHLPPVETKTYELGPVDASLPKVLYIHQNPTWTETPVQSVYFYGQPLNQSLPTLVHPNELLDGALTSLSVGARAHCASSWLQVNHPVVHELYEEHGRTLNFLGVLLMRTRWETVEEKKLIANQGAKMAQLLGADGAIVTWWLAGNAFIESMLTVEACEQLGIKTVLMTYEYGGADRMEPPVLFFSPAADAVVSTGARDVPIVLPPVRRVVGGDDIAPAPEIPDERVPAAGEIRFKNILELYSSVDVFGIDRRRCMIY